MRRRRENEELREQCAKKTTKKHEKKDRKNGKRNVRRIMRFRFRSMKGEEEERAEREGRRRARNHVKKFVPSHPSFPTRLALARHFLSFYSESSFCGNGSDPLAAITPFVSFLRVVPIDSRIIARFPRESADPMSAIGSKRLTRLSSRGRRTFG